MRSDRGEWEQNVDFFPVEMMSGGCLHPSQPPFWVSEGVRDRYLTGVLWGLSGTPLSGAWCHAGVR